MAQFGIDLYLKTKYGSTVTPSFSVEPFTATQLDQGTIHVDWSTPISSQGSLWSTFRLVRSTSGTPAHERDGVNLLEFDVDGEPFTSFADPNVTPGRTYYYGIFLAVKHSAYSASRAYGLGDPVIFNSKSYISLLESNVGNLPTDANSWQPTSDPQTWYLAGSVSLHFAKDYGHSKLLYKAVPRPYRSLNGLQYEDYNEPLARFLNVFGFQLNAIQGEYELLSQLNDTRICSPDSLDALAQQFGFQHERTAAPRLKRLRTRNHADLMRTKGSALGLTNAINAIVGWDVDVSVGANEMLTVFQSDFASLVFEDWDKDTPYVTAPVPDRVRYGAWLYQATAPGKNQKPSGTAASTGNWTPLNATLDSTYNDPATGGVSTWGLTASAGTPKTQLAVGLDSPLDSTHDGTGLAFSSSATGSLLLSSVAPLVAKSFTAGSTPYAKGSYVTSGGQTYRATRDTTGLAVPGMSTDWALVRIDLSPQLDREQLVASAIPLPKDKPYALGHYYDTGEIVITPGNRRYKALRDGNLSDPDLLTGKYGDGRYGLDQRYGGTVDTTDWQYIGDAGDAWTFSLYLRRGTTGTGTLPAAVSIDWYDINGTFLATADTAVPETRSHTVASSPVANLGSTWSRVWLSARPPVDVNVQDPATGTWTTTAPRAAFAVLKASVSAVPANTLIYARCAQFELGEAPSAFVPARQAVVNVLAGRINWCANPSFSVSTSGWTGITASLTTSTQQANVGQQSLLVKASKATSRYAASYLSDGGTILPDDVLTVSGYVSSPDGAEVLQASFQWLDANSNVLGTATGPATTVRPADGWVRLAASATAPAGTVMVNASFARIGTAPSGERFFLANVLIEKTEGLRDYFDGDIYSADFIWEGTPGLSRTHYYEGFRDKQYRMEDIVVQHIPLGTPFVLLYAQSPVTWVPPVVTGGGGYDLDGYDQDGYNQ